MVDVEAPYPTDWDGSGESAYSLLIFLTAIQTGTNLNANSMKAK